MLKYLIITFTLITMAFALAAQSKKETPKNDQMDEGDKLLLQRDACRKPMEALETKYDHVDKKKLIKMKKDCPY